MVFILFVLSYQMVVMLCTRSHLMYVNIAVVFIDMITFGKFTAKCDYFVYISRTALARYRIGIEPMFL